MRKILLIIFCLILVLFLLPGGLAWEGALGIDGSISTGQWPNDEDNKETVTFSAPSTFGSGLTKSEDEDDDQAPDKISAPQYIIEIHVQGEGSTSPSGNLDVKSGDTLDISAVTEQGWQFSHWYSGGKEINMPVVVSEHMEIIAVFKEKPLSDDENGEDKQDEEEQDSKDKEAAGNDEKKDDEDKECGSDSDDNVNDE